jgi:putative transposase
LKQIYIESYFKNGYRRFMKYVHDVFDHPKRDAIDERLKIIEFCEKFGFAATKQAYGKSRSTIFLWKQKLKKGDGKLSALAPGDRIPRNKRHRIIHPFIEDFIIRYRADHPGVDKTTITPALTAACLKDGIKPVSESTVGRIINDLKRKGRIPKSNKVSIIGRTGRLMSREPRQPRKKTRRKGFYPTRPGELVEIDTVSIFVDGLKRYLLTAIDLPTRFAFAYTYKSSSSANARDFLEKLKSVTPFRIQRVQTDNGHEFEKLFSQACLRENLVHYYNYPRHPQSNSHLERFNRTVQEQFAYWNIDILDEPDDFNRKLMNYLIWYNTEKPHRGIGKLPPLRYYLNNFVPPQKSNMLWTLTSY